jgi:hypothetical protein
MSEARDFVTKQSLVCADCKCPIDPMDEVRVKTLSGVRTHYHIDVKKCLGLAKAARKAPSVEQLPQSKKRKSGARKYGRFSGNWY